MYVQAAVWSPDSKLLMVQLYDGDEDSLVVTVDPVAGASSLAPVDTGRGLASTASWATRGHVLYSAVWGYQAKGLYLVDPMSHKSRPVFTSHYVTSNISVTADRIFVRVSSEPYSGYELVSVDSHSGRMVPLRVEPPPRR
jgi:hypothetical protein